MVILFKNLNEIIQVFTNSILLVSGKDINELTTVTLENSLIFGFGKMDECSKND